LTNKQSSEGVKSGEYVIVGNLKIDFIGFLQGTSMRGLVKKRVFGKFPGLANQHVSFF
jgi:hypothetical protein